MSGYHTDFNIKRERRGTGSIKWDTIPDGVIGMSIADSDWETAPPVLEAIRRVIDSRPTLGYGFNDFGLSDSIVSWYKRLYNLDIDKSWVVPISGIVPAFGTLANIKSGDVLLAEPGYSMMLRAPARAGKKAIITKLSERNTGETLTYEYDFDDLSEKAKLAETFFLCNPHNPTGHVYTRDELQNLASFARKYDLLTVSDEIHCELVFDGKHIPWFSIEPYSITLIAPGKVCNMPGIHGAAAIIPDEELRNTVRRAFGHGGVSGLNAAAIAGAFSEEADEWKAAQLEHLRSNRDYLRSEFRCRLPLAGITECSATYLLWADVSAYIKGDAVAFLKENAKVALAGGGDFGGGEGNIRINFATDRATLNDAAERIIKALTTKINTK